MVIRHSETIWNITRDVNRLGSFLTIKERLEVVLFLFPRYQKLNKKVKNCQYLKRMQELKKIIRLNHKNGVH